MRADRAPHSDAAGPSRTPPVSSALPLLQLLRGLLIWLPHQVLYIGSVIRIWITIRWENYLPTRFCRFSKICRLHYMHGRLCRIKLGLQCKANSMRVQFDQNVLSSGKNFNYQGKRDWSDMTVSCYKIPLVTFSNLCFIQNAGNSEAVGIFCTGYVNTKLLFFFGERKYLEKWLLLSVS